MSHIIVIYRIIVDEGVDVGIKRVAVLVLHVDPQVVSSLVIVGTAGCRTLVAFLSEVNSLVQDLLRNETRFLLVSCNKI